MKKDGILLMILGLLITFFTAFLYFSPNQEKVMNKVIININKSYHFNWSPMIGISVLVIGEFLLWESRNNSDLKEAKYKILNNYKLRITDLVRKLNYKSVNKYLSISV